MSDSASATSSATNNATNTNNSGDNGANVNTNVNTNSVDNNVNTNSDNGQKDVQTDGLDNLFDNASQDNQDGKEGDKGESNIPESYTFTDADGNDLGLDAEATQGFTEAFKEIGLSQEQANKAFNMYVNDIKELTQQMQQEQSQVQKDTVASWRKSVLNDAELGGENLQQTRQNINKALQQFGSEDLRALLNSGVGYNPAMVRLLNSIGSQLGNDSNFISGKGVTQATESSYERAKRLYPNSPSLWH